MANLSSIDLKPGDLIYHPITDPNVGFAIEEVSVIKLIGPSKNPYGYSWIKWSFGDVAFLKEQQTKREGAPRVFLKINCFASIEDCIDFLEERRLKFIENQKNKKEEVIIEVIETEKLLKDLKKESVEVSRKVNKNVSMLNKFDIRRDLEKRGLV